MHETEFFNMKVSQYSLSLGEDVMSVGLGVVVNGQQLAGTAKWADILKVYEIDGMCCIICCIM
jgi:hypothetical protein